MDLLHGSIPKLYFKYLGAAFGSALISSIYGIVDMAMVGQYQGPQGTAALAVVAPVWNIIYSLGLLTGIGGAVLLAKAKGEGDAAAQGQYYTAALLGTVVLAALCWLAVGLWDAPLLRLFGAQSEELLSLARQYLQFVKPAVPLFLFNQTLSAFLRNDNAPGRATAAVLAGGAFNVFGDWFFVFGLNMGIRGAGLATALGAALTFAVLLTHFFSRRCTLRLCRPTRLLRRWRRIGAVGFSTFFIDAAMGILTTLFNRQIVRYLGTDALAVYGVIVNISTIVQCCAYSVGQAAQPILAQNYGAHQWGRVRATLRCALAATAFFSLAWTAAALALPLPIVSIFMQPTAAIAAITPGIVRQYGLSFLLLPLNIFSTYYFQSLMQPGIALGVSVARGMVVSGALIYLLPAVFGGGAVWLAMPLTELLVAAAVVVCMARCTRRLGR